MKPVTIEPSNRSEAVDSGRRVNRDAIVARVYAKSTGREQSLWEDPYLYLLAFVVGLVAVVAVLFRGGRWGAEPTAGAVFVLFSGAALVKVGLSRFVITRLRKRNGSPGPSHDSARPHT
jgi:hypothetical protein